MGFQAEATSAGDSEAEGEEMGRGRLAFAAAAVSCLLAACGSGGGEAAPTPSEGGGTATSAATTSSVNAMTTSGDLPSTTLAPETTVATTVAVPVTPAPTAAPPPPPVVTAAPTTAPRAQCIAAFDPPADAANLKATYADVDADGRIDVLWLYDAADGTHLQVRTGRGATDNVILGYGTGAVAVGSGQVDLAMGSADPGTPQEILAVTSAGDARRLVGVYGFAIATGCLQSFTFDQGNPFVYLISRQGALSGLRCVNDGVNGHLESFTASPAAGDAFTTTHQVFGRQDKTRRLVPVSYDSGTLPAPADPAALALGSDITGCSLSQPAF
jgi:hypothetical protein